jgi:hypothetical protein
MAIRPAQEEFVAALDPGGEFIYFRLEPLNLTPMIAFIHGAHLGGR